MAGGGTFLRQWLERRIIGFTQGMDLYGKILSMYILILLIPTLLLGSGAIYLVIQSFHNSFLATVDEAVRQTARNVDFGKQSYDLLAVRTATDGELVARLGREYTDRADIVDTVNYVDRTFLVTSKYLPGIADFRIYHTNDTLVQDGQLLWRPEDRPLAGRDEQSWFEEVVNSPDSLHWASVPGNPNQIVLSRKIINPTGNILGAVYILLNYDAVFGDLLGQPFKDNGSLYVIDSSRQILAGTNREVIGNRMLPDEAAGGKAAKPVNANVYNPHETKALVISKPLSSGWQVVAVIHAKFVDGQNWTVLILMISIMAFFLLLSIFLMLTIIKNIVLRIRRLGNRMSDLSRGEFEVMVRSSGHDELGELENIFNSMSGRLGKLVQDIRMAGVMEKEQAFKALQAQINPHFVYNSLGLLRWRALDLQDEEQLRIIDALTVFYRLTLNNNISVVPIAEELQHVQAYMEIQQLRYPDRVQVEWEIDEEALRYFTVKTILQPIVENCYQHGSITRKKDALIIISVRYEQEKIALTVFDNGKGIPAEELKDVREGRTVSKNRSNGFGTANIKERLSLYFGGEASFEIESEAGEWTLVTIKFPACTEPMSLGKDV
ncbi:sensor histidine kinase [Paenibacillus sp. JW14]|uniref:histidine kinase n=1 Tax=Paenibacillus agri TaxID=2744309 RepID=A0A850EEG6_9BACL|nr:sensor histidine kinase [Paenibacillus agri]